MASIKNVLKKQQDFFRADHTKDIDFRIRQLKKLKRGIIQKEAKILEALYLDLGKSKTEAFMTEIAMVYSEIDTALKHIRRWSKPVRVRGSLGAFPSIDYIYSEPYGTVLIMAPWNYPFNLAMSPLVAAIAAGNCAMVKCSRTSVHTARVIKDILEENYGAGYIFPIDIEAEYNQIINQKYDYIFFTGSPNVGKKIMRAAADYLIPVSLELGGKSPCIVDESADIRLAAKRIAWGKFLNAGQTCISIDYVLIQETVKEEFIRALQKEIEKHYSVNSDTYPRIINQHHFKRLTALLGTEEHVIGGETNEDENKIGPTIFPESDFDHEIMKEEIFGPILPIIRYRSMDEAIQKIKEREKPLACYLFTNRKRAERKVLRSISYGGGCINDVVMHFTNHRLPFGGVGLSGIGSYHGKYGFDTLSHKKSVVKSIGKIDLPFRYKPFDEKKFKMLKKIF